jgi:hypothetical protein
MVPDYSWFAVNSQHLLPFLAIGVGQLGNEKYKTIAATARCSISTVVNVARASGLSRRGKYRSAEV